MEMSVRVENTILSCKKTLNNLEIFMTLGSGGFAITAVLRLHGTYCMKGVLSEYIYMRYIHISSNKTINYTGRTTESNHFRTQKSLVNKGIKNHLPKRKC